MPNQVTFTLPPKVKPPKESWWVGKSREELAQAVQADLPRLMTSAILTPTAKDTMTTMQKVHNTSRMRRAEDGGRLV